MILSNIELHRALDSGRLIIRPEPTPRVLDPTDPKQYCPYDSHSVDLTLAEEIVIPGSGPFNFDLSQPEPLGPFLTKISERVMLNRSTGFTLKPNSFILARTREYVGLPIDHPGNGETCLAARIEGKSSRARVGLLIHFTAPTVHPGWAGTLTLEMINLGPATILLRPGMPIAQLIVEEVRGVPRSNPSQFQGQTKPEGSAS